MTVLSVQYIDGALYAVAERDPATIDQDVAGTYRVTYSHEPATAWVNVGPTGEDVYTFEYSTNGTTWTVGSTTAAGMRKVINTPTPGTTMYYRATISSVVSPVVAISLPIITNLDVSYINNVLYATLHSTDESHPYVLQYSSNNVDWETETLAIGTHQVEHTPDINETMYYRAFYLEGYVSNTETVLGVTVPITVGVAVSWVGTKLIAVLINDDDVTGTHRVTTSPSGSTHWATTYEDDPGVYAFQYSNNGTSWTTEIADMPMVHTVTHPPVGNSRMYYRVVKAGVNSASVFVDGLDNADWRIMPGKRKRRRPHWDGTCVKARRDIEVRA